MKPLDKYTLFLIEQAQAGRKNSYIELIGYYKKQVYLRSLQLLGKTSDAEKVSQEVFFRAWKNLNMVNENIPFELWLRGLTINIAMEHYRTDSKDNTEKIKKNNLSAKNDLDLKFLQLSPTARQILILHDLEGYSFSDIAVLLDEEEDYSDFEKILSEARLSIADENELKTLEKFEEDEWLKIISDFDFWPVDKTSSKNITDKIKTVLNFREKLGSLFSSNEPSEETFEKLINYFFVHGEIVVKKRKKEREIWKTSFLDAEAGGKNRNSKEIKKSIETEKSISAETILEIIPRGKGKKTFYIIGSIAALVIIFILIYKPSNFPWKVTASYGKYLVGSLENKKVINGGDIIKTRAGSGVTFQIESIGKVELKENATAKALTGDKKTSVIKLIEGALKLSTKTEVSKLQIMGDDFKLIDYGSDTFFSLDSQMVSVQRGSVKLFYDGKEFLIFEDYEYAFGKAAPININTNEELVAVVNQISIPVKFDSNLEKTISLFNESDALTIWTLLRYSDKGATAMLFNKLNEFFPLSENISPNDILSLNKEKLNDWLDEIEWQL